MKQESFFDKIRGVLAALSPNGQAAGAGLPRNSRLLYREEGRCGWVRFQSDVTSFDLYWEFGGGDVVAIIDVPTAADWTAKTRLPVEQRSQVLRFIAETVIEEKFAGGNSYEIGDHWISIFELGRKAKPEQKLTAQ